ncbi:FtsX-like permease family protein [Actinophytocola sp.]|uniref:FtsX-like permease family protein n=1 Tax=Actinophytocola sp. TaxID=1872138 RepID=UPI002ED774EA
MIALALASLRHRLAAFVATFLAVLVGSALLVACGGLFETALRLNAQPQRLAGAELLVTGSEGFKLPDQESETVPYAERSGVNMARLSQLRALPGVADAWADLSFPAVVAGQAPTGGTVLSGHDWASAGITPYTLTDGAAPHEGEVVLDAATASRARVHPGDDVRLVVSGRPESFTVAGVAASRQHVDAAAMFFATTDVDRLSAHPDTADVIGIRPADGVSADELAGRLPAGLTVLTGEDRGAAEFPGIAGSMLPLILLSSIFGGMVLVVMALVVWATISLSVRQRQRELALLRATGATPAQTRTLVVAETMAVAVLAAAGGLLLGSVVGDVIFRLSAERGVVPAALEFRQGPIPFAAGALLALVAPWLAARFAAGAAARTKPVQALVEASIPPATVHPARRLLARVFVAGTGALAVSTMFLDPDTAAAVGGPAVLTGAIAVALLGPELVDLLVARAAPAIRRLAGRHGPLAVINTRSRAVQFAAVLTPLTLATAIALGNVYSQTTMDAAALDAHVGELRADAVVGSAAGGIAPGLLDTIRDTPGVTAAAALVTSSGWLERPYDGRGSDPWPFVGISDGSALATPVTAGSLTDLDGNTVALPASQAEDLGLTVGSAVTLRLGDGTRAKVRVVALLDSPSNYGSVVVPASLLAPHTLTGLPSHVLVQGNPAGLQQRLRDFPGTTLGGQDALAAEFAQGQNVQAWINYLLAALALAYAAIASVNTLAVAVLSRRRELAVQRLAGATRREVTRMLAVESAVIAVAGLALGAVIALCTVLPTAVAVGSWIPTGPVWVLLATIAAVFLIVHPVTLVTARLAMRRAAISTV